MSSSEQLTEDELHEKKIAQDTLERYSGSPINEFQPYILLTNFPRYVDFFASQYPSTTYEGAMFKAAHCKDLQISILDFKIGSPAAALIIDLLAFQPINGILVLGMCGGLREIYQIGDFFIPIASIRGEGTSDFYFPSEVPAMANFTVQKVVATVLENAQIQHHIGITHTTNKRFWEFNPEFRHRLIITRPQSVEMECATLFAASYSHKLPLGALLLISDLPLMPKGSKTKASSEAIFSTYMPKHVHLGVEIIRSLQQISRLKVYREQFH